MELYKFIPSEANKIGCKESNVNKRCLFSLILCNFLGNKGNWI